MKSWARNLPGRRKSKCKSPSGFQGWNIFKEQKERRRRVTGRAVQARRACRYEFGFQPKYGGRLLAEAM